MNTKRKNLNISESNFAILLTFLFFILGLVLAFRHEMWHDETCEWLIARDSHSFVSLLNNYSTMRHPIGWVFLLWLLNKFTTNIFSMQLLSLILATSAIYIFARFSPFSRTFKTLFSFGYFPFYEYRAICGEYVLGMLVLFVFAALYKNRQKLFIPFSLVIALLANTSLLTFVFSIIIFAFLVFDTFIFLNEKNKIQKVSNIIIGFILIIVSIIFSFTRLRPFTSNEDIANIYFPIKNFLVSNTITTIISFLFTLLSQVFSMAFLPVPVPVIQFWYTNFLLFLNFLYF